MKYLVTENSTQLNGKLQSKPGSIFQQDEKIKANRSAYMRRSTLLYALSGIGILALSKKKKDCNLRKNLNKFVVASLQHIFLIHLNAKRTL